MHSDWISRNTSIPEGPSTPFVRPRAEIETDDALDECDFPLPSLFITTAKVFKDQDFRRKFLSIAQTMYTTTDVEKIDEDQ